MRKILSAVGSDVIRELLSEYGVMADIPYQEGVIEVEKAED